MTSPIKVETARTLGNATLLRDALRNEGIEAELRGEHRASLGGELPMAETEIEIWTAEADAARAREILQNLRRPDAAPPCLCPSCREKNPGNFDLCWACQSPLGDVRLAVPLTTEPKPDPDRQLLVIASLVAIVCAAGGYFTGSRRPHVDTGKTYQRWNLAKTCVEEVRSSSGKTISKHCDEDGNGFFEVASYYAPAGWLQSEAFDPNGWGTPQRFVTYGPDGAKLSESFDADENLVMERQLTFGRDGTELGDYTDADQDGRPEKFVETLAGGLTSVWTDTDLDGIYELRTLMREGKVIKIEQERGAAGFVTMPLP